MQNMISVETFASITKAVAKESKVPVGLHLDHCASLDTIKAAIKAGFTSVMIDGSQMPFDENVDITKKVVEMAHKTGVSVEAELGLVGVASNVGDFKDKSLYTRTDKAVEFIDKTNVDALAIAMGNAHGFYVETPSLAFDVLEDINTAIDTPLVLHGGSGISDEQLKQAFEMGINKLNVGTEYFHQFHTSVKNYDGTKYESDNYFTFWNYQKKLVHEYLTYKLGLTK